MDINELSKEMYQGIPMGSCLFTIDKIGLQIATRHLNKKAIEPWKTSNFITILTFGETAQINVHAEFEPWENHLGKKCLDAVCLLILNGVFNLTFTLPFLDYFFTFIIPLMYNNKSLCIPILSYFFKIVEMEWAWDFLDKPVFTHIDNDKDNKKSLVNYMNSNYSKDGRQIKRLKERNGKKLSLSKGRQQSLIIEYDKDKKINSDRLIKRVEVRQQGKYKKDLTIDLLHGTKEEAISKALPAIKKAVKKVIHKDALVHTDYWKQNAPAEYKEVFINKN